MITLRAGCLDVDVGKNEGHINHAHLYQPGDEAFGQYEYVGEDDTPIIEMKRVLSRPLHRVKPRLEMLGYTLESCKKRFHEWGVEDDGPTPSFEAFQYALRSLPWIEQGPFVDFDEAIREAYARAPGSGYDETVMASTIAWERLLDPYLVLRVLAEFPEFDDLPINWNFDDVLEGGWITEGGVAPRPPAERWVVVTEGSSDTLILERSLKALHSDIYDFFDFIDMSAGNPFPGVGNIVVFCKGLSRIRYAGRVVVVLDNDTAGQMALRGIQALQMPRTFRATCLPDLPALTQIRTLGPAGEAVEDINGRAAAIECFLEFVQISGQPTVRWTTYERKLDAYQGELVAKEDYATDFRERFGRDPSYDTTKLQALWAHLIATCEAATLTI
jgi:hypothetical protein